MVLYTCANSTHNRDERQRTTTDRRTDDNEEGEIALVEKAYLTVVTIIICFTVVTIIYPDCKVINSLGAMANAALRTRTWLDVKKVGGLPYNIDSRVESFYSTIYAYSLQLLIVEFTTVLHHAKYQYRCS